MAALLWILAILLVIIGLIGVVVPALPGPVLVFACLFLAAWIDGFELYDNILKGRIRG